MKKQIELRNINRMAYPVLMNYLLMSVFEILDKAIVGHYSVQGFAAVGIAAAPIYAITGALGILSSAFHIVGAESCGKKDYDGFEMTFTVSKKLACMIGIAFFLVSLAGGKFFFQRGYGIKGETLTELLSYFYPAAFTVVQNMLLFQYSVYNRNRLNTKISFFSTAVSTFVNLFFDVSLVYGVCGMPRMGTAGAAWGSVIGLFAGLLVYQIPYYTGRTKAGNDSNGAEKRKIRKKLLALYPSLAGQEFVENTLFVMILSGTVANMGMQHMAVYSLLDTVANMIEQPIYAYASAAQTYALQHQSAGRGKEAESYLKSGQRITMLVIAGLGGICYVWQKQIFHWIVTDDVTVFRAGEFLFWIVAIALTKVVYQFRMGYLQGIGKEKYVLGSAVISTVMASAGVAVLGGILGLPGVYFVLGGKYLILSLVFLWKNG
ncbi:MAG: hypothetical protein KH828_12055 [Clostridiales bacterium]|nr:hypothetical protein [Clostridiales bacterium]